MGWVKPLCSPILATTSSVVNRYRLASFGGGRVGLGPGAGKFAAFYDQVLLAYGATCEPVLQNLAGSCRVARLCRETGIGHVRCHPVLGHCAPRLVSGRRLRRPHVTGISGELSRLKGTNDRVPVHDFGTRRVHDLGSAFHPSDEFVIKEVVRVRAKRCMDGHHVDGLHQRCCAGVKG